MTFRCMDRRKFLATAGSGCLLPAAASARTSGGQDKDREWTPAMPGTAFDFGRVEDLAASLAASPHQSNATPLPDALAELPPEKYHAIRFHPQGTLWQDGMSPFQVQFFPRGSYFRHAVAINIIDGDEVTPLPYTPDLFDFGGAGLEAPPPENLGFAGFRLMYPLNSAERFDELAAFLGASYFRVVAKDQHYGLSARGLAIDTGLPKKEEFPYFREFWLQKPQAGARSIEFFALLDSESLTGAYHFRLTPGEESKMDVRASLYTRAAVEKLGLAPLTSMFFYGENTTRQVDDLRPEVHDSDGMLLANGRGEWIWRPLTNRDTLQISSFADQNPRGFGLMQRDRDSRHYQDLELNYERRPCAWIEPQAPWGKGAAQLIEIPSDSERYDNIGLLWVPERPVEAGQVWSFAYRLRFASHYTDFPDSGSTLATREASGSDEGLRRFAIEFGGGPLTELTDTQDVQLIVSASSGQVLKTSSHRNPATGTWLAHFELDPEGEDAVELRAFLRDQNHALTETWSYLWKRS